MQYIYRSVPFSLPEDLIEQFQTILGIEFSQNEVDLYSSLALERANLTTDQINSDVLSELVADELIRHIGGYQPYGS